MVYAFLKIKRSFCFNKVVICFHNVPTINILFWNLYFHVRMTINKDTVFLSGSYKNKEQVSTHSLTIEIVLGSLLVQHGFLLSFYVVTNHPGSLHCLCSFLPGMGMKWKGELDKIMLEWEHEKKMLEWELKKKKNSVRKFCKEKLFFCNLEFDKKMKKREGEKVWHAWEQTHS